MTTAAAVEDSLEYCLSGGFLPRTNTVYPARTGQLALAAEGRRRKLRRDGASPAPRWFLGQPGHRLDRQNVRFEGPERGRGSGRGGAFQWFLPLRAGGLVQITGAEARYLCRRADGGRAVAAVRSEHERGGGAKEERCRREM